MIKDQKGYLVTTRDHQSTFWTRKLPKIAKILSPLSALNRQILTLLLISKAFGCQIKVYGVEIFDSANLESRK